MNVPPKSLERPRIINSEVFAPSSGTKHSKVGIEKSGPVHEMHVQTRI